MYNTANVIQWSLVGLLLKIEKFCPVPLFYPTFSFQVFQKTKGPHKTQVLRACVVWALQCSHYSKPQLLRPRRSSIWGVQHLSCVFAYAVLLPGRTLVHLQLSTHPSSFNCGDIGTESFTQVKGRAHPLCSSAPCTDFSSVFLTPWNCNLSISLQQSPKFSQRKNYFFNLLFLEPVAGAIFFLNDIKDIETMDVTPDQIVAKSHLAHIHYHDLLFLCFLVTGSMEWQSALTYPGPSERGLVCLVDCRHPP